tara:strand:+ start:445 stop:1233 length:789 start_codon:yes stop_codon:yes gene_type:complete
MITKLKSKLHEVIFEADTKAGKAFDVALLIVIALSVLLTMLETVPSLGKKYEVIFNWSEWIFSALFTIEYALRIWVVTNSKKYIFSSMGIIDFLATIPTYIAIFIVEGQYFGMLRIFRVLKLVRYMEGADTLKKALMATRGKIVAFLVFVFCLVVIMGTIMYVIEDKQNGFTSIPKSVYWSIVTLTTVGYGDIAPQTALGQFLASIIMVMGYGILAVPTGLVSVEAIKIDRKSLSTQVCQNCNDENHLAEAKHCKSCGEKLA